VAPPDEGRRPRRTESGESPAATNHPNGTTVPQPSVNVPQSSACGGWCLTLGHEERVDVGRAFGACPCPASSAPEPVDPETWAEFLRLWPALAAASGLDPETERRFRPPRHLTVVTG
jgi:hypothetical protein